MPSADEITKICQKICRRHPDAPARTLARRIVAETNGAITLDSARSRVRYIFGASGKYKRKYAIGGDKTLFRKRRRPGEIHKMPVSKAEPWGPYQLDVVGLVGVLSDIHVPYHSEIALTAAVEHLKAKKIDALVLNGDIADFYSISRFDKNPKRRNFKGEVEQVRQLLAWLRQEFPEIPIVYKAGNHEERWTAWLWQRAPEISDDPRTGLDQWLDFAAHGVTLVDDKRPIMAGELPILHGHEKQRGIAAPVNQARGAFLAFHHTVLEGHGHRTSGHCEPDMFGREVFCWSTGCLCDLRPEYAKFNKYNWGFATVRVHDDGSFDVSNMRITADGKVRSS